MSQHDFQFFGNLVIVFLQKKKLSNVPFLYLFFTFVQNFKTKKKKKCVFECFQSHCHILKELREFCE
jgi:hypothetical protein